MLDDRRRTLIPSVLLDYLSVVPTWNPAGRLAIFSALLVLLLLLGVLGFVSVACILVVCLGLGVLVTCVLLFFCFFLLVPELSVFCNKPRVFVVEAAFFVVLVGG